MVELFTNNAHGTLLAGISAGDLTLTLNSGQGALFPNPVAPDFFRTSLIRADLSVVEIVKCTARSGDVLTIQRGLEGTTPASFSASDRVRHRPTAGMFEGLAGVPNFEKLAKQIGHVSDGSAFINDWGMSGVSTGGTNSHSGTSASSLQTSIPGVTNITTTGAQIGGMGIAITQGRLWRGNATGRGGFDLWIRWGLVADISAVFGYWGIDTQTSYTGGSPDGRTAVGQCGVGFSSASSPGGNYFVYHSDGSGGPVTAVDTGIARNTTSIMALRVFALPFASQIQIELYDLKSGGASFLYTVTTNLPSTGSLMSARHLLSGAIGASNKLVGCHRFDVNQGEPIL